MWREIGPNGRTRRHMKLMYTYVTYRGHHPTQGGSPPRLYGKKTCGWCQKVRGTHSWWTSRGRGHSIDKWLIGSDQSTSYLIASWGGRQRACDFEMYSWWDILRELDQDGTWNPMCWGCYEVKLSRWILWVGWQAHLLTWWIYCKMTRIHSRDKTHVTCPMDMLWWTDLHIELKYWHSAWNHPLYHSWTSFWWDLPLFWLLLPGKDPLRFQKHYCLHYEFKNAGIVRRVHMSCSSCMPLCQMCQHGQSLKR